MNEKGISTLGNFRNILKVRNYSSTTINNYSHYVDKMISHFNKPALHITANDIKNYLLNYNYTSIAQQNTIYSAFKLFCKYILHFKLLKNIFLERPRKERKLPQIISKQHILNSIAKITNIKHKAIIALTYCTGMRVSEICNLKITDVDSTRMIIAINQAKDKKDRIVPFSNNVLEILRNYYKIYRPKEYLYNGA